MLDVLKCIAPMILAVVFTYTAAVFASMGFKKGADKKLAFIGATIIELVSFTIWLPCFNDLFSVIGLENDAKRNAMIISTCVVLLGTAIATVFNLRKKET